MVSRDRAPTSRERSLLGLDQDITRRDFIGTSLVGAGAALMTRPAPAFAQGLGDDWTGPGGIGDYARSNGNTAAVVNAAHGIRDGEYERRLGSAESLAESYDLVIVGSGFSGITAAYEFHKARGDASKCLVLDNHPVFGGEAKQNEFEVDGYHLYGPQGSNDNIVPHLPGPNASLHQQTSYKYWSELGLPTCFEFAELEGAAPGLKVSRDNYAAMFWDEDAASVGFCFETDGGQPPVWVKDMWRDRLARAPLADGERRDLLAWRYSTQDYGPGKDRDSWLDSMSYAEFMQKVMKLGPAVCDYIDPILGVGDCGLTSDAYSAYAAARQGYPGVSKYEPEPPPAMFSFPGGNAALLRHFVKSLNPASIHGGTGFADIVGQPIDFDALDRPGLPAAIRLGATVVAVEHDGPPESAGTVAVTYSKDGRLYRVHGRAVVMCIGAWVAKHVIRDLPPAHRAALGQFHHGPVLTVNVALRNWRFMDRLGISAARWFRGLGFFTNIRAPMVVGPHSAPLHPDKPVVLTFYISFGRRGLPVAEQGAQARMQLFTTSYAGFEAQIREQMQQRFGDHGFDAKRDIAGIVLNRWGHALICPQPGFFFGNSTGDAPSQILRNGFGRIAFGHSELNGFQDWVFAAMEGNRAAHQAMAML